MAQQSHNKPVGDESLEEWEKIGFGGFGDVYKARHKTWRFDVAIKILRRDVCTSPSLWDEASVMSRTSCPSVLRLYGTYKGFLPIGGETVQRRPEGETSQEGLVMEFMERGSVQSLFEELSGPPPWPLVCRLANQVALGINCLHQLNLMHHDLKPSNVLLDADLNAKLADFGLSRVSTSCMVPKRETGRPYGSYKYMPPEAFNLSYQPVRSFDIYSYGILLWSIISGKEPYPSNNSELVENGVTRGDRPCLKEFVEKKEGGLNELVALMRQCWHHDPSKRPLIENVHKTTEAVFSKQKNGIHDAVGQVLRVPKAPIGNQPCERTMPNDTVDYRSPIQKAPISNQPCERTMPNDTVDYRSPIQIQDPIRVSPREMSWAEKGKFVDDNRSELIGKVTSVMEITDRLGEMVHNDARQTMKILSIPNSMRELYKSLHSGGDEVKAAFYDALKELHPELVEQLGG
ncbi:receptor-interacting serine/threonine-protein kinase 3-like isoform X1 [Pungitius pungitius]|uniref:receptor-interacting serine/threonine-protein kinase 3-like isoform X1 n=1 Tax=Pungitius pungitius TaxID=134920 RepID=UPI0018871960|nr:receptor-interacting serine/threonine-protein kinase 3-like isoform X1 [Pungitius pungitius]XP_037308481.1 receptor-interacting serine/threonine-protein kinase 3-like isoform X1 [Pungitius pungitius]XP_037308482.1 receptor-interacting serine/threonine-protein kinase 3-like isoform X1 [Pungitius pungitius]XP_037308484.1 receptor-interacting serine/threonine-protein kinase 3-like isoform X1 [Pungitius pungitius]XP_037308485.1 receptor-interacting serine/threonine-protein kinase 3-like isoform 